jgi:hypothetical protein
MFAKVAQAFGASEAFGKSKAVFEVSIIPIILSCASKISMKRNSKSQKDTSYPDGFWEKTPSRPIFDSLWCVFR